MGRVNLKFDVEFEDCDDDAVESVTRLTREIRDALVRGIEESGVELRVTKNFRETENGQELQSASYVQVDQTEELAARVRELHAENTYLKMLADEPKGGE